MTTPAPSPSSLVARAARWPWGTVVLFLVSGTVLAAQAIVRRGWDGWLLTPNNQAFPSALTYAFFHADVLHWAVNMAVLFLIGPRLERAVGTAAMLAFFVAGALVAGLLHLSMVVLFNQAGQPLLGASGGIMALAGMYAVRYYSHRVAPLPVPIGWALFAYILSEGVLGCRELLAGRASVAHWAHVGGFLAGMTLAVASGMRKAGLREDAVSPKSLDQQARRLAEYLRDHPDDAASRVTYAGILARLGETDRAARAYGKAMDLWLAQGRKREAGDAYLEFQAARLPSASPAVEMKAARALEETGRPEDALLVYDRLAATPGPEAESASLRAAQLCQRLGRAEDARQRFQMFLLMFPQSQFIGQVRKSLARLAPGP